MNNPDVHGKIGERNIIRHDGQEYSFPPDYVTTEERMKPVAERRGERCQNLIFCAALFAGSGIVAGAVAMWLYAGGC